MGVQVYTIEDLMEMFQIGYSRAAKMMREIKSYKDTLGIKGRVLITDYQAWCER